MKKIVFKHISNKILIAFILCIVVPLLFINMLSYQKTYKIMTNNTHRFVNNIMDYVMKDFDNFTKECDLELINIYERESIFDNIKGLISGDVERLEAEVEIDNALYGFLINQRLFQEIYLMDEAGNVYMASRKKELTHQAILDYYKQNDALQAQIEEAEGSCVWFAYDNEKTGDRVICIGRVIKNIYGDFAPCATTLAIVDQKHINAICDKVYLPQHTNFYVLDRHQSILISRTNSTISIPMTDLITMAPNNVQSYTSTEGDKYTTLCHVSKQNGWTYIELIKEDKLTTDIFEIRNYNKFIIIISMIFVIILSLLISKHISKPIKQLAEGIERVKHGDTETSIDIKSDDEVGILCQDFNAMRERINRLITDIKSAGEKEKEAEIQALKAQFNPHFLYNTLTAINWLAVKHGEETISDMITNLSDIMRYSLDRNTGDIVTLREDIQWTKKYLAIQKLRFENAFDVIFNIDPLTLECKVHKLLIQPLLENSILHGFEDMEGHGVIVVNIIGKDDHIHFEIMDNGKGMDESLVGQLLKMDTSHMGISNVHSKLKLYYGEDYGLEVTSTPNMGTKIRFSIPSLD